jgi:small subunit ribosomal protein S21
MFRIKVENKNIEFALKKLKNKVKRSKQNKQLKDNKKYIKPAVDKREKKKKAIYNEKLRRENEDN